MSWINIIDKLFSSLYLTKPMISVYIIQCRRKVWKFGGAHNNRLSFEIKSLLLFLTNIGGAIAFPAPQVPLVLSLKCIVHTFTSFLYLRSCWPISNSESAMIFLANICYNSFFNWKTEKKTYFGPLRNLVSFSTT